MPNMTVAELKLIATELGIAFKSKVLKADLESMIAAKRAELVMEIAEIEEASADIACALPVRTDADIAADRDFSAEWQLAMGARTGDAETDAILSDETTMTDIANGMHDVATGNVTELPAEPTNRAMRREAKRRSHRRPDGVLKRARQDAREGIRAQRY